jgi:hypothetical protein
MKIAKVAIIGSILILVMTVVVTIITTLPTSTHAAGLTASAQKTNTIALAANAATPIPAAIAVPAGNVLLAQIFGTGVLTFACPTSAASAEIPTIITSNDAAAKQIIGSHFMDVAGLAWEGLNGDRVIAAPVAKVVVNPNNAPWVLLKATLNSGTGMFAKVTFIQRVFTQGGIPPVAGCQNAQQAEVEVPFRTQYRLFGAAA